VMQMSLRLYVVVVVVVIVVVVVVVVVISPLIITKCSTGMIPPSSPKVTLIGDVDFKVDFALILLPVRLDVV